MKAAGNQVRFSPPCLPLLELEEGYARAEYCELLRTQVEEARAQHAETCTLIKPDFTTEEGVMDPDDIRVQLQENPSCDHLMTDLPRRLGPLPLYRETLGNSILLRQPAPPLLPAKAPAKVDPPACTGESCVRRTFAQLGFSPDINARGHDTLQVLTSVAGERLGAELSIRYHVIETSTAYTVHCHDIRDSQGRPVENGKGPLSITVKKQRGGNWRERAVFELQFRTDTGDRQRQGLIASVRLVTL